MRVISIDTLIMKQLASAASSANESINDAVEALNRISVHNDWGCREKNAINDYTVVNKNKIKQLQENSRAFLNSVSKASNDFEESENSIIDWAVNIDKIIPSLIGIVDINNAPTHTGEMYKQPESIVAGVLKDIDIEKIISVVPIGISHFEILKTFDPIPICSFDDINL